MYRIGEWLRRVWYLFNRARIEAELTREMEAHRAMTGEPVRFGDPLRLREESREVWGWIWLDNIVRDFRFAARGLGRTPAFTLVAILSLALGLSLTASTISVVNAYLIRSLPYPHPDRLYHVMYAPPGPWEPAGMTGLDWTSLADVVEAPIASSGDTFYLRDGDYTQSARGLRVMLGFVEGLRVPVASGRTLMEQDFLPGSERAALIGHSVWRERFGSDPRAIGRLIRAEAESHTGQLETFRIVGVLSPGFYFGRDSRNTVDLLVPLASAVRTYMVRLREGVPVDAAERRITEVARQAATTPIPGGWTGVRLESAHERYVGALRPILAGVTGAASLVLIIGSANLAVLMLLRSMRRQKEVALRLAFGSGWCDIARMLLTESAIICAAALGVGLAITSFTLGALAPVIETQLVRPAPQGTSTIAVDATVLIAVGGVSVAVALLLSLAPLLMLEGQQLTDALRQDGRGAVAGSSMRRMRSVLIAFELAGSLMLLVGCGLMVRSILHLDRSRPFRLQGIVDRWWRCLSDAGVSGVTGQTDDVLAD